MRRADDRRSASVMIRSSIRWSLAGNDVDWIMNTSEPRTLSRISTKISLSAKRRTLALVSGRCSQLAISWASTGLELPATSLIEPFLAAIDASPRALLDTTFSISRNPRNRRVSMGEETSGRGRGRRCIRSSVNHTGQTAEASLRNFPQYEVVGRRPGVASGLAGRFFAGKPQCTLLVVVVDVPDPGDHGLAAHHLRRQIAAHAV